MSQNYLVYPITKDGAKLVYGDAVGYRTKLEAYAAAKRLAGKPAKFRSCGLTAVAYVGQLVTAVVSW